MAHSDLQWRKPTRCDSNQCVETAKTDKHVYVRNSNHPDGAVVRFTHDEWDVFVRSLTDEAAA